MHNLQDRILNSTKIHFFTSYTKSFLRKKKRFPSDNAIP